MFPGDAGIGDGIAQSANAFMPRVGVAWDPTGTGMWSVRASYGLFYDQFQNGSGTASQVAISAMPWAQFNQFSGAGLNFQNPYRGRAYPAPNTFVRPSTVFAIDVDAKPPYVAELERERAAVAFEQYLVEVRYVGAGAITCRATSKPTRRSTAPAPRRRTPIAAASTPTARPTAAPATSRPSRCSATSPVRRTTPASPACPGASRGVGFNVSYWLSKSIDYLSSMNLSGAAAKPLAGENDLAQNPFDLEAELEIAPRVGPPAYLKASSGHVSYPYSPGRGIVRNVHTSFPLITSYARMSPGGDP